MKEIIDLLTNLNAITNPVTGKKIEFKIKQRENVFLRYYGENREMFCYTPHADTEGNYWCFTYKPFGPGARKGEAKQWKLVDLVRCAKRKVAQQKSYKRFLKSKAKDATSS